MVRSHKKIYWTLDVQICFGCNASIAVAGKPVFRCENNKLFFFHTYKL